MEQKSSAKSTERKTFIEDPRYKYCNKEAIYGIVLGVFNLIWWFAFGYGLGSRPVEEYHYILGFPAWFFLSSIVGSVIIIIATFYIVNHKMTDMSLDRLTEEEAKAFEEKMGGKK